MHYANGRRAQVGDVVRGKGYNIKHEIVGVLVQAKPNSESCNCQVATVTKQPNLIEYFDGYNYVAYKPAVGPPSVSVALHIIEYGQLDAFVALDPETGEVLPPIEETAE